MTKRPHRNGRAALLAAAATATLASAVRADAQDQALERVDLELVLAVDISGSMDYGEQLVQRDGYVAAFRDESVIAAMTGGYYGAVAVTYIEWANEYSQHQAIPWTVIDSPESAEAFAAAIEASPIYTDMGTSISGALRVSADAIDTNAYQGSRRVIDVSGDGSNKDGRPLEPIRAALDAQGIVVNGLPLMLRPGIGGRGRRGGWGGFEVADLEAYYRENVIVGPGAFVIPVRGLDELKGSIRQKLILEIAGLSPPESHREAALAPQ